MKPVVSKWLRVLALIAGVLVVVMLAALGWGYVQLRASLPQLDGTAALPGASAAVTVQRDALGIPTIRGQTRADVARALGFLHGQERFFQMDLMRRKAAGELAELFGRGALGIDRATRIHGFRGLAEHVLAHADPQRRAVAEAYAAGVNAGLTSLHKKPFEYLVLRADPRPWQPVDSVLVIYAMTLDLQDSTGEYDRMLGEIRDHLGNAAVSFFAPVSTSNDAALDGSNGSDAPIPTARAINLRAGSVAALPITLPPARLAQDEPAGDWEFPGSNSFALASAHTANGAALLANDPHLNLGLPNTWYRAVMEFPEGPRLRRLAGVTLPGVPYLVLGSNGDIAWGLTVAYVDTGDVATVELNELDRHAYKIPGDNELHPLEVRHETIRVKGGDAVTADYEWTRWGPVIGRDAKQRLICYRWIAHDREATNLLFGDLESTNDARTAIDIAHRAGIPAQNFIVADRAGTIAWTVAGAVPHRIGFDGRLPTFWNYGDRRWDGRLQPPDIPTVFAPANGRLWTANNRVVGGDALAKLGDGGYADPARGAQLRDDLAKLEKAAPKDFLAIQLDDRALFLERWQKLLLRVLSDDAVRNHPDRAELRRLVEHWDGRAAVDSVSYRLVRAFRLQAASLSLAPLFAPCVQEMPDFHWYRLMYEPALWTMVTRKPMNLLAPTYASWDDLLLAAADAVPAALQKQGTPMAKATWGSLNRANIRHPFSLVLPAWATSWLNLPRDPLPGDSNMPRIQSPSFGASMRLVVSPGHEEEGILHMPGGQSGHPLSPFYRAGSESWVHGDPTPLLPGTPQHTLTLSP